MTENLPEPAPGESPEKVLPESDMGGSAPCLLADPHEIDPAYLGLVPSPDEVGAHRE